MKSYCLPSKKTPQKQLKLGKRKNNQILTIHPQRKVAKLKINQNLTLHRPTKIAKRRKTQNLTTQTTLKLGKRKNIQNLTYEKPSKLTKLDEDYYKPTLVKSGYNNNYIQYESKGDKILTVKEYLGLIESYLADMINDYKSKAEWKIQLTADINFTSLKPDSDETRIMHTKSHNKEIMNS